jgi:hypothetical protein
VVDPVPARPVFAHELAQVDGVVELDGVAGQPDPAGDP